MVVLGLAAVVTVTQLDQGFLARTPSSHYAWTYGKPTCRLPPPRGNARISFQKAFLSQAPSETNPFWKGRGRHHDRRYLSILRWNRCSQKIRNLHHHKERRRGASQHCDQGIQCLPQRPPRALPLAQRPRSRYGHNGIQFSEGASCKSFWNSSSFGNRLRCSVPIDHDIASPSFIGDSLCLSVVFIDDTLPQKHLRSSPFSQNQPDRSTFARGSIVSRTVRLPVYISTRSYLSFFDQVLPVPSMR